MIMKIFLKREHILNNVNNKDEKFIEGPLHTPENPHFNDAFVHKLKAYLMVFLYSMFMNLNKPSHSAPTYVLCQNTLKW